MSKLVKRSVSYILIGFLPVAANFFLAPVYASYLKPSEYAIIGLATLFQTFLHFFLSLSLDGALNRLFFTYEKKEKLSAALLSTLLLAVIGATGLVLALLMLCGDYLFGFMFTNKIFRFSTLGIWVLLTTFSNVIFALYAVVYRNQEKVKAFVVLSLSFFFLPVAGTLVGLIFLKKEAEGAIIGRALGSAAVIVFLLLYYFSKHRFFFRGKMLRKALVYSLPLIPYQIMFALFTNIDRIILERYFTADTFGIYNFAVLLSGLIPVFINALNNAVYPKIYRELANNADHTRIRRLNYASSMVLIGMICVATALIVPVMRVVISESYAGSYLFIGTLFLSYLPYIHYLVFTIPLFYYGKTKAFPVISFFALAGGILFNVLLVPYLGVWSVCLSLYIIRGIQLAMSYFYVRRHDYSDLSYLEQAGKLKGSMLIMLVYNGALLAHLRYNWLSIDLVNLVPLLAFFPVMLVVYKKEVGVRFDLSFLRSILGG